MNASRRSSKWPRYVDRQFCGSLLLAIGFYASALAACVALGWFGRRYAAAGFLLFLLWAYRWPLGARLKLCARRPGALRWPPRS